MLTWAKHFWVLTKNQIKQEKLRHRQVNVCNPRIKYFTGGCDFKIYIRHIFPHWSPFGGNSRQSLVSSQDNNLHVRNPTSYYGENTACCTCVWAFCQNQEHLLTWGVVCDTSVPQSYFITYIRTHTHLYTHQIPAAVFSVHPTRITLTHKTCLTY